MTLVYLDGRFAPLAEAGVPITDRGLTFGDGVYEVYRGTPAEVMAVTAIDGRLVGGGRPGPITRRVLDAFRRLV